MTTHTCAARRLVAGLLLAAGLAAPLVSPASAEPQIRVQGAPAYGYTTGQREMRFGDLDLASEAGRAKLETRLKVAAGTVCGKRSLWTVRPPADYTRCYDNALGAAHIQMDERLAAGETVIRLASN